CGPGSPAPEVRAVRATPKCLASIPVPPSALAGYPFRPALRRGRSTGGLGQEPPPAGAGGETPNRCAQPRPRARAGASLMPGPMVELIDTFLMKVPLAPDGLARLMALTRARTLAAIASSLNEALPTPA